MAELRFKYADIYTERYAFQHMQRYLSDEALAFHEKHARELLAVVQRPNPAYQRAINEAHQEPLRAARAAHTGPSDQLPTVVTLTDEQLLEAVRGIDHMLEEEVVANPVAVFLEWLEVEFPVKNAEKVQELMDVKRRPGETLKMLYRRLDDLR